MKINRLYSVVPWLRNDLGRAHEDRCLVCGVLQFNYDCCLTADDFGADNLEAGRSREKKAVEILFQGSTEPVWLAGLVCERVLEGMEAIQSPLLGSREALVHGLCI